MSRLGRYTIVRKLATGGMAEVYLARVAGPGGFEKHVVLKSILPALSDNDYYVKMFLEEARIAAQLDHPNIVHVYDFGEIEGTYFLTMEYVEGATVRQLQRWSRKAGNETLSATLAARIIADACTGLQYAHEFVPPEGSDVKRLVHRDVSPENIMLTKNGTVKLLDFGVAKNVAEEERSMAGMVKGKVSYMPPEQLTGKELDHRADIYALGVVLYQLLSGRRPYERPNDVAMIEAVMREEPVPLMKYRLDLPDNVLELTMKAIAKKADQRFQSCDALREALEGFIANEGQVAGPTQLAKLVQRYLADEKLAGPTQQPGSRPGSSSSASPVRSVSEVSAVEVGKNTPPPPPKPSAPLAHTMQQAARSTPGVRGPFAASARPVPMELTEYQLEAELLDDEPKTDPGGPSMDAMLRSAGATPLARPSVPRRRASSVAIPITEPAVPSVKRGGATGPARRWRKSPIGVEPIRQALRENLRADRSTSVLRKLPALLGRLSDVAPDTPWALREVLAGVFDAAVLSDDHAAIASVLERAARSPGRERRFARLVDDELASPLRIAWLVERLRSGLPADVGGLRSWLLRLSASAAPLLVTALESQERWAEQQPFAEALASAALLDPNVVLKPLDTPTAKTAAAFSFALEKSGVDGREEVFARLLARSIALEAEVLSGRARAREGDAMPLLMTYLAHAKGDLRCRALELCGELGGEGGFEWLSRRIIDPTFDERPAMERELTWSALMQAGGDAGFATAGLALFEKAGLLKKRRFDERKLAIIEALKKSKTEAAGALLERAASEPGQSAAVAAEARAALSSPAVVMGEPESRARLVARVSLELALLARASTTVDVGTGVLDGALERFRDGVRQVQLRDGWMNLESTESGPSLNDGEVSFAAFHEAAAPEWERALRARDLKGLSVAGPVTVQELRSFLFRAFDPDGRTEPLKTITAFTFAGKPLGRQPDLAPGDDATGRVREVYAAVVAWLEQQRDALRAGKGPDLHAVDHELDEWAVLMADGDVTELGLVRFSATERGRLEHAVNTAALGMAFANDLGLPRSALREVAELALVLGLADAVEPANEPRGPANEDHLHAAALLLTHRLNRLGTAAAVAAYEAGSPPGGVVSVVTSLHALAKAYDGHVSGAGLTAADALQRMNSERTRFSPELLGLFTQWTFSQSAG